MVSVFMGACVGACLAVCVRVRGCVRLWRGSLFG